MPSVLSVIYLLICLFVSQSGFCSDPASAGFDDGGYVPTKKARNTTRFLVDYETFEVAGGARFQCYQVDLSVLPGLESVALEEKITFTPESLQDSNVPKMLHKSDSFWEHLHPSKIKQRDLSEHHGLVVGTLGEESEKPAGVACETTESLLKKDVDRRVRIDLDDDSNLHYLCNGRVEMRFRHKDGSANAVVFVGSAFMASERCAVTCGHNIFLPKAVQDKYPHLEPLADSVRFMPGLQGTEANFDVKAKSFHIAPEWVATDGQDCANDLALLYFDDNFDDEDSKPQPLGKHIGFVRLAALEDGELKDKEISVTGYPGEKSGFMYTMKGKIVRFDETILWHDVDTTFGNSGSKIGWHDSSRPESVAIGVHTRGVGASGHNSGVRLTKEKLDLIKQWKQTVVAGK